MCQISFIKFSIRAKTSQTNNLEKKWIFLICGPEKKPETKENPNLPRYTRG